MIFFKKKLPTDIEPIINQTIGGQSVIFRMCKEILKLLQLLAFAIKLSQMIRMKPSCISTITLIHLITRTAKEDATIISGMSSYSSNCLFNQLLYLSINTFPIFLSSIQFDQDQFFQGKILSRNLSQYLVLNLLIFLAV